MKQAFLHEQLIVGFSQTLHNRAFIAPEHIFNNLEGMIAFFNKVMNHKERILEQIDLQKKTAMSEEATVYTDLLK